MATKRSVPHTETTRGFQPGMAVAELRKAFARYDPIDVMSGVAGLSLYPPNSRRILRLEACAEIAATSSRPAKKTRLTLEKLRDLIVAAAKGLPDVVRNEDPFNGPMVEGAVVFGRDVQLLPGLAPEDLFSFRKLARALEGADLPIALRSTSDLLRGVAAISSEIVKRAGLPHACPPEAADDAVIAFPASDVFEKARRAVRFRTEDLVALCKSFETELSALDPIVQDLGSRRVPVFSAEDGFLTSRPIVFADGWYVVAAPHCLLRSVFLHLLRKCDDLQADLAARFHSTCDDWLRAFAPMICESVPSKCQPISSGGWLYTGWGIDVDIDKAIFVALVTESGTEPPNLDTLEEVLIADLAAVPSDRDVLLCVLYQRLFLPIGLPRRAFSHLGARRLTFSLQDLETLLYSGDHGPLHFWYYAGALDHFEAQTHVGPGITPLDLWALYSDHENSFNLADDERPSWIALPCYASDLRCKSARDRRRHGVPHYSEHRCVEVVSATAESRTLTFVAVEEPDRHVLQVVEVGVPVWIRAAEIADRPVAEAVAFWLGELTSHLHQVLRAAYTEPLSRLLVDVQCSAPTDVGSLRSGSESPRVQAYPGDSLIIVEIPSATPFATGANEGERDLVGRLYSAFMHLVGDDVDDDRVRRVVDDVAPLGPKKHFHVTVDTEHPEMDSTDLSPPRPIQVEVTEAILDDLGAHLRRTGKFTVGVVDPSLLKEAVTYLFERLRDAVAVLTPEGLLESLIAAHEAIIRETVWFERTLPAQKAVARDEATFIHHASTYMPKLAETAVAGRFLIEYVTATSPVGSCGLSRTRLDELISLASMLATYGTLSDVSHLGLVDLAPELLSGGRLGVDHQRMKAILEIVHSRRALTGATKVGRLPSVRTTTGAGSTPPWWKERLDPLLRAELGYSLQEYADLVSVLMELAYEGSRDVACRCRSEVIDAVVKALEWDAPQVERVLDALTLRRRDAFMPSSSSEKIHVYPWRYNRDLSYLRRPLVLRESGDNAWLLWGPRNLYRASQYLLVLITEGRLRVQPGGDLARCLSDIAGEQHEMFNDEVADWFAAQGHHTRRRLAKVGSTRLSDDAGNLGDVDVLVIDEVHRRILAVECKDVHLALAAQDIANQLAELHKKFMVHRRRVDWLVRHAAKLQAALDLSPGEWEILCVAVTDETLVSQTFRELPVPILAFAEITNRSEAAWASALVVGRVTFTKA